MIVYDLYMIDHNHHKDQRSIALLFTGFLDRQVFEDHRHSSSAAPRNS